MQKFQDIYLEAKNLNNDQLRKIIRSEKFRGQTSGLSKNYLQTNLIILDKKYALDFMIFCQRNPKACPLVGVTDVGDPFFRTLGNDIDVRHDVPSYNIYSNGKLLKLVNNIADLWSDSLVAFAIGCSFTFEHSLMKHGFKIDHIENNKVVPMYKTNIKNINVINAIDPDKDVDGFVRNTSYIPATALGVMHIFSEYDISLENKNIVKIKLQIQTFENSESLDNSLELLRIIEPAITKPKLIKNDRIPNPNFVKIIQLDS